MQEKIKTWLQRVANADPAKREKLVRGFIVCNVLGVGLVLSGLYAVGGPGMPFAVKVAELIGVGIVIAVGLGNWHKIAKPLRELLGLKALPETMTASLLFMTLPAILLGDLINLCFSISSSGGGYTGHFLPWHRDLGCNDAGNQASGGLAITAVG